MELNQRLPSTNVILRRHRSGKCSLERRVYFRGQTASFGLGRIEEARWSKEKLHYAGTDERSRAITSAMRNWDSDIVAAYHKLKAANQPVTAKSLLAAAIPQGVTGTISLLEVAKEQYAATKGRRTKRSNVVYGRFLGPFQEFVERRQAETENILDISQLTEGLGQEFHAYLLKRYNPNTASRTMIWLKGVSLYAHRKGYLPRHELATLRIGRYDAVHKYLTVDDLAKLHNATFLESGKDLTRRLILFISYTGLSITDLQGLTPDNIRNDGQGRPWLSYDRQKTKVNGRLLLSSEAVALLESLQTSYRMREGKLLPFITPPAGNRLLKEIAADLALSCKDLSWHVGRKTCATLLLEAGASIDTVATVLGHSTTRETAKVYAKVTNVKLQSELVAAHSAMKAAVSFSTSNPANTL